MTSITLGKKLSSHSKPAPAKRKPVFGDDDSDGEEQASAAVQNGGQEILTFDEDVKPVETQLTSAKQKPSAVPAKSTLKTKLPSDQSQSLSSLRSTKQATGDIDESVYDYDSFHSAAAAARDARKEEAAKSTGNGQDYMSDLMAAAKQREKDQLRAKDRLLQREREQEGDEFKDKDMFVTEAYKEQQAEMRRTEEEEKKREEEQERKKKAVGMSGFHRAMMDEQDKSHKDALQAEKLMKESGAHADTDLNDSDKEKTEAELAEKLAAQGRGVELTDEGQAVDKRELLSGGLNIVLKPKTANSKVTGSNNAAQKASQPAFRPDMDARQAQRERQTRMMEAQLEAATKRKAEEEAEEVQKRERAAKSQKTEGEVTSAKERYLQRKREAAAEKARGEG